MDTLEPTLLCESEQSNALSSAKELDSDNKLNSKPGAVGNLVGAEGRNRTGTGYSPTGFWDQRVYQFRHFGRLIS